MAIPAYVASPGDYTIMSAHDYIKQPQKLMEVYAQHGLQYNNFYNWFRMMNRVLPVKSNTWSGFEKGWVHTYITTTGNVASPGQGNPVTLTIAAGDHQDGKTYANPGDIVGFAGADLVQGRIMYKTTTNSTAHTITIEPIRATDTIPAVTSGTQIGIWSFAAGMGTGSPEGHLTFPVERTFKTQTFKEALSFEGQELIPQLWFTSYAADGRTINGYWSDMYFDTEYRFALKRGNAYMLGKDNTNTGLVVSATEAARWSGSPGSGNPIQTTKGLLTWGAELGSSNEIDVGDFAMTDFEDMGVYYKSQKVASDVIAVFMGYKRHNELNTVLKNYTTYSGVDWTKNQIQRLEGHEAVDAFVATFNFNGCDHAGIKWMFTTLDDLSDPRTFPSAYKMDEWMFAVPIANSKDAKTGEVLKNIAIRYPENYGYSRLNEKGIFGGAGGGFRYTTDVDSKTEWLRSEEGFQMFHANQVYIIHPAY